jgi:putative addiction module killer protein
MYYARDGRSAILLLCGGDKRNQAKDIERAREYWKDYKIRQRAVPRGGPHQE